MSMFIRTFAPLRASRAGLVARPVASFSTSGLRAAMSEADHDHPERSSTIDRHKKDSVSRAKDGKGEWKPELASASEQAHKADKSEMSMEEMQKLGEEKAEKGKQPSGSSSNKV